MVRKRFAKNGARCRARWTGSLWMLMVWTCLTGVAVAQEPIRSLGMRIVPYTHEIETTAGAESQVTLELENLGSQELTAVALSAQAPVGWAVTLDPTQIASIAPGSVRSVVVTIRPPRDGSGRREYVMLTAEANQLQRSLRVEVDVRRPRLLWIGLGVLLLVIAAFAVIYWRFGRAEGDQPARRES